MPRPIKGESKDKYIKRAIPIFQSEGYSHEAAVGRAYGFWDTYGGGKKHAKKDKKK